MLLAAGAAIATAQPGAAVVPPDSAGAFRILAPADSAAAPQTFAPTDTAAARRIVAKTPWSDQPRFVMLRSLLVPGWGQFHNRAYFKAAGVAGAEGWLISLIFQDKRALDDLYAEIQAAQAANDNQGYAEAVSSYNARLDTYVGHQWLLGGVLAYALVDAYVDAHFRSFDLEFRHDPALPDDLPPDPDAPRGGAAAKGGRTRVALRWHF